MKNKEKLQLLAEEFNVVLGLDPVISLELSEEKLLKEINEAKAMIEPGDTLTEKAQEILAELDLPEAPEAENEKKDSIEVIPLKTQIEDAERLKDLRDIAKANDEFKSIRGQLTKWKTKMSLIDVMLDVLDDMEGKEMQEKEEPVKESSIPAKEKKKEKSSVKEKEQEKKVSVGKKEKLTRIEAFAQIFHSEIPLTIAEYVQEMCKIFPEEKNIITFSRHINDYTNVLRKLGYMEKTKDNKLQKVK